MRRLSTSVLILAAAILTPAGAMASVVQPTPDHVDALATPDHSLACWQIDEGAAMLTEDLHAFHTVRTVLPEPSNPGGPPRYGRANAPSLHILEAPASERLPGAAGQRAT